MTPEEPPLPPTDAARAQWADIRLLVLDFDGVLTDNTVVIGSDGSEMVSCWRGDGIGLAALRDIGVDTFVLSKERNPVVSVRCEKLGVDCRQGVDAKGPELTRLVAERGLTMAQVAYVGNDVNDRPCLELVGLPIVVADAHPDVVHLAAHVTRLPGGRGAVREVCDHIVAGHAARVDG